MSSSSGVRAGDIVPPLVIVAVVVAVIVIVVARKRLTKKTEEQNHEFDGEEKEKQEEESIPLVPVTMKTEEEKSDFKKSNVEKSVLLGDTALLTGCNRNNNTSVVWRFNKNELPNDNGRFRVREDGSLQISSIRLADCGVYDCEAAEISQCCTVKLTVEFPTQHPKPIKLNDFEQYLKDMHADENHGFKRQFSALEEAEHPCTIAKMPYNKKKNRYRNIVPYDHSRVVLEGKPDLDYINASYIHGYDGPNKYIATQGPMSNTVNDFWKMVWETNCLSIVMLANVLEKGKKKCEKYWPDTVQLYDNICVRLSTVVSTSEFDIRTLIVNQLPTAENEERTVKQFHFSSWPDHGVPMYPTSLLNFMKLVRAHQESSEKAGPIAVHCSAGAGRSGTYIAIENCLREIQLENELNIFRWIKEMREDRPQMVQNEEQFIFCHDAVLEHILCGNTGVQAPDLETHMAQLNIVDETTQTDGYDKEMKLLTRVSPDPSRFTTNDASKPINLKKNRYLTNLPPDRCHIKLLPISSDRSLPYINACILDGHRQRQSYITTQGPLASTITEFWHMVWQKTCSTIVMLTSVEEQGAEMSATYWPTDGILEVDSIIVKSEKVTSLTGYCVRTFSVTSEKEIRTVVQFHVTDWPEDHCPESAQTLLMVIDELQRKQRQSGDKPTIVMCNNGIDRSGTFCAINILLERLKSEQVVDVYQVVKFLRSQNPKLVRKKDHYKLCYAAALEYLETFDDYANFKEL
jgi:protein tyrosine phosphatase